METIQNNDASMNLCDISDRQNEKKESFVSRSACGSSCLPVAFSSFRAIYYSSNSLCLY